MMEHRNFTGHGESPPFADWPGGARVAVSFVLNVEEGSERTVSRGDAVNEPVYDMIETIDDIVNLTMESHFDYGPRAGYWRVVRVLEKYGVTCTANICAEAVEISPWWGEDLVARGFEVSCHGYRWESPLGMTEDAERAWIARSVAALERVLRSTPGGLALSLPSHRQHAPSAHRGGRVSLRQRRLRRRPALSRRCRRSPARRYPLQPGHQRHAHAAPRMRIPCAPRISLTM